MPIVILAFFFSGNFVPNSDILQIDWGLTRLHCHMLVTIFTLLFNIFYIQFFGGIFEPETCCSPD